MEEILAKEEANGIKFVWNKLPSNRADAGKLVIPVGFHYTPLIKNDNIQLLEYMPLKCKCGSIISPLFSYSTKSKVWECPFCHSRNAFPKAYADFISDENLPQELLPENSTVEYKLVNNKPSNPPIIIFLLDIAIDEDELNELKESIQQTISSLPQDCNVGIITYGKMCNVIEVGSTDFTVSYALNGEKAYSRAEIQELLGLLVRNNNSLNEGTFVNQNNRPKFIMPLSEVSFTVNSFLDDLSPDGWERPPDTRESNCCGLAVNTAVSLLEAYGRNENSRIMIFMGGPCNIGEGKIVGTDLKETIRNYVDFEKGNSNTKYYKQAVSFYDDIAKRASLFGIAIDIFSCCLNQVGLYEMKTLPSKTGGNMIFTDSFSTMIFKDSLKKIFEQDENNFLKMNFKGKMTFNCTSNYKVSGAMGHLLSLNKKGPLVSDLKIGESDTTEWNVGSLQPSSTYTIFLDPNIQQKEMGTSCTIQILTTYIAGDYSTRLRVSTFTRKIFNEVESPQSVDQIGNSFDQEAAAVLISRMCVKKNESGEDSKEVLKWVDKNIIHLMSKFAKYVKDVPSSFKLTNKFSYFPQFMFYLRRSSFIQSFNESPDESTYYKFLLQLETVQNCTIMIQPLLFEYTAENQSPTPVYLDLNSLKNDVVLLLDTFFYVVVWNGSEVVKWREEGFQNQEGYENIKSMIEEPQDYAQNIVIERLPTPRYVNCDSGSGQERLLKCIVNPSTDVKNKSKDMGFFSDDVDLKVFMEFLKKLTVNS